MTAARSVGGKATPQPFGTLVEMTMDDNKRRTWLALLGVLILAAGLRLYLVLQGGLTHFLTIVPDDAFYYLQIARHLALGHGSTFDGLTVTNGYHPLWMILLLPLAKLAPTGPGLIYLATGLATLLNLASGVVLLAVLRRLAVSPWLAVTVTALYLFNHRIVWASLDCLETSLNLFLLALFTYLFLGPREQARQRLALAITGGLLLLVRTDNILFWVAFSLVLGLEVVRRRAKLSHLALHGGVAVALVLPWLLWNYLHFGSIVQSSGQAAPYIAKQARLLAEAVEGNLLLPASALQRLAETLWQWVPEVSPDRFVFRLLLLLLVGAWLSRAIPPAARHSLWAGLRQMAPLVLGGLLLLSFHTAVRGQVREWYWAPQVLAGTTVLALVAQCLWAVTANWRPAVRRPVLGVLGLGLAVLAVMGIGQRLGTLGHPNGFIQGPQFLEASYWLREHTPPDARIGCFNAGLMSFFSERTVINLDGVISAQALTAIRQHDLQRHLDHLELDYVVDFSYMWEAPVYRLLLTGGRPGGLESWPVVKRFLGLKWHDTYLTVLRPPDP